MSVLASCQESNNRVDGVNGGVQTPLEVIGVSNSAERADSKDSLIASLKQEIITLKVNRNREDVVYKEKLEYFTARSEVLIDERDEEIARNISLVATIRKLEVKNCALENRIEQFDCDMAEQNRKLAEFERDIDILKAEKTRDSSEIEKLQLELSNLKTARQKNVEFLQKKIYLQDDHLREFAKKTKTMESTERNLLEKIDRLDREVTRAEEERDKFKALFENSEKKVEEKKTEIQNQEVSKNTMCIKLHAQISTLIGDLNG